METSATKLAQESPSTLLHYPLQSAHAAEVRVRRPLSTGEKTRRLWSALFAMPRLYPLTCTSVQSASRRIVSCPPNPLVHSMASSVPQPVPGSQIDEERERLLKELKSQPFASHTQINAASRSAASPTPA